MCAAEFTLCGKLCLWCLRISSGRAGKVQKVAKHPLLTRICFCLHWSSTALTDHSSKMLRLVGNSFNRVTVSRHADLCFHQARPISRLCCRPSQCGVNRNTTNLHSRPSMRCASVHSQEQAEQDEHSIHQVSASCIQAHVAGIGQHALPFTCDSTDGVIPAMHLVG